MRDLRLEVKPLTSNLKRSDPQTKRSFLIERHAGKGDDGAGLRSEGLAIF
jgi:hypothetical protein